MVATAALHFMQKRTEEAQTVLFQWSVMESIEMKFSINEVFISMYHFSIQLKPVPVYGLFAACAFGMMSSSLKLSKLVLKELEAFKNQTECIKHIAIFRSYCEVFQVLRGFIRGISKSLDIILMYFFFRKISKMRSTL